MVTVKQYQEFCKIPSGSTQMEYNKTIASLIGLDVNKLTSSEIDTKVKEWLSRITISKLKKDYIKLGRKWYKVDRDLYSLAFSQWIYFDDTMRGADKSNTHEIMHFLIATFTRECRFYKFFPKEFNINNIEKNAKIVQEKLNIETALELINFFFWSIIHSINNTQVEYSEKLDLDIWVQMKD